MVRPAQGAPRLRRSRVHRFGGLLMALGVLAAVLPLPSSLVEAAPAPFHSAHTSDGATANRPSTAPARIGAYFERNDGQTDGSVAYVARTGNTALFIQPQGIRVELFNETADPAQHAGPQDPRRDHPTISEAAFSASWAGANPHASVTAEDQLPGVVNYFIGNDAKSWHSSVPTFGQVTVHGVYSGVDVVYHATTDGGVEYDYEVAPGTGHRRTRRTRSDIGPRTSGTGTPISSFRRFHRGIAHPRGGAGGPGRGRGTARHHR